MLATFEMCIRDRPLGVYGWGRGAGWYTLGLIATYKELPDGEDKQWLKAVSYTHLDVYKRQILNHLDIILK